MTSKLVVGIIFGGRSGEHEVSLMSARSVLSVIDREKYEVVEIGITLDGRWYSGVNVLEAFLRGQVQDLVQVFLMPDPDIQILYAMSSATRNQKASISPMVKLDVVFPILHGTFGEDGTLQGFFDLANIAYVGAGVLGSAIGMDKGVFVDVMRAYNMPVVDTLVFTANEISSQIDHVMDEAEGLAPYPLFVKPANLGSSVGISKCKSRSDLVEGILEAVRYYRRILIQRGINAREIEVSVLGNDQPEVSIPGEIIPSREFYSYEAKYIDNASTLIIPAPISKAQMDMVQELAIKAYRAVDCAGMARVDFLLDKDSEELYINEINTVPGFTTISMYPKLWEASGVTYSDLIDRLIDLALQRKTERDRIERVFHSKE